MPTISLGAEVDPALENSQRWDMLTLAIALAFLSKNVVLSLFLGALSDYKTGEILKERDFIDYETGKLNWIIGDPEGLQVMITPEIYAGILIQTLTLT
ncbi:hypothetical protein [Desulfosporosinus shakirovi]|uniref:hypothetical protein n=1 Tax=Desulfosporosinus shakirovi TaxID=2885154 RepID=UPI001E33DF49|nr:hypothetical protein [Desulfosporosinus sp. SRJS8]